MDTNRKIKIAMICHFSNAEVRQHLPLQDSRALYHFVRKFLGMAGKRKGYSDIAPWDTNIIKCVKERNDIELHVVSAHGGLKKRMVNFSSEGIDYFFLSCELSNFLKKVIPNDGLWRWLNPIAWQVKRIINKIMPDLVLLVGAENAYYSSSVLKLDGYPIYLLCQTIYNNPEYKAAGTYSSKNATTEIEILKKVEYAAVYSKKHYELLRDLGYDKNVLVFNWPVPGTQDFTPTPFNKKKYDFINFALHMSNEKGYYDCVKALAIVKKKYPNVKLDLVDGGNDDVRKELKQLIVDLCLEENVTFTPFFVERNDLFQHLQEVRFAVLPCKVDHISGTQLQSMQFGMPVVCYETTGTPTLNKEEECVLIAEMNNVEQLAEKMLLLMDDPELAERLKKNSLEFTRKRVEKAMGNMDRLVDNFVAIIDNFKEGTPIPVNQLFNPMIED